MRSIPLLFRMSKVGHILGKDGARRLSAVEAAVVRALADEHGRFGEYSDMSLIELMYRTSLSRSGVQKGLRSLSLAGGITIDRPEHQGAGQVSRYHIHADKFYRPADALEGLTRKALKGSPGGQKGSPGKPLSIYTSLPPSTPPRKPNFVEAENVVEKPRERAYGKGARTHAERDEKTGINLDVIHALMLTKLAKVDGRLARDLANDCLKVNPEVTTEQITAALGMVFENGIPSHIRRPNGFVRRETADLVRAGYLKALDRVAQKQIDELMAKASAEGNKSAKSGVN